MRASLAAYMVKNPPAMQKTWVQSLDWEDLLKKGKATHYSILAWRIPWTEGPARLYSPWGNKEPEITEQLSLSQSLPIKFSKPCPKTMKFRVNYYLK